jgi:hypothetical protein
MLETRAQGNMFGVDGMVRSFLLGTAIGGLLTFVVTAGITLLATQDVWPSVGVGVFAAFWGGPGFGGMLGAIAAATRTEHGPSLERSSTPD